MEDGQDHLVLARLQLDLADLDAHRLGANYPNENVFREIQPAAKIVIEHVVKPWFKLTVTLTARGDQTHPAWIQELESPEFAAKMRPLSGTANEQVLDRLQARLASETVDRAVELQILNRPSGG